MSMVRLRRRRFFLVRVADEPVLDIAQFLRGHLSMDQLAQCTLLCPIRGEPLPLTPADVALAMEVPAHRWLAAEEVQAHPDEKRGRLLDLARRGVLVADPAAGDWTDIAHAEEALERVQWYDLAAMYQAHSRWQAVTGGGVTAEVDDLSRDSAVDAKRKRHGDAPPHFFHRKDTLARVALRVPAVDGAFFAALMARRTTRAYAGEQQLPLCALETMLYAVFGVQGTMQLAAGMTVLKRSSPSAGALHPIEAYVLAINVQDVCCGLYHYETSSHSLAQIEEMSCASARNLAREFTAGQAYFAEAHALVVHVARFDRTFWKYGQHHKAYKAVLMDCAHLSQTFYLTAAHLGLGAFFTSAINDDDIARRLRLESPREAAVGINGVGVMESGRDELHLRSVPYVPTGIA